MRALRPLAGALRHVVVLVCLFASMPRVAAEAPDCATLAHAIDTAAGFLADSVTPSGKMTYRQYADGRSLPDKYNLLRHAGALYALGSVEDPAAHGPALLRAARWLHACCVQPVPGFEAIAAPWWPPVRGDPRCLEAKLGGAGLTLIALLEANRLAPATIPAQDLRRLARFVVYMQRPDGSFFSKYRPCDGGRDDRWTSLYYPGEAALALVRYARVDGAPLWHEAAVAALDYLARARAGQRAVPADHWALIATAALFELETPLDATRRARLLAHVAQVAEAIAKTTRVTAGDDPAHGSFGRGGRIAPTATRLEALLAARRLLSREASSTPVLARLDPILTQGVAFLLRAQRRAPPARGALPRAITSGTRSGELRIDYTQHALSVLLGYRAEVLRCP